MITNLKMSNLNLIFAGAGSGKTHILTSLLAERLLVEENPISPEQILVSTFTHAAATEIRDRVQQAVAAAGGSPELLMALRSAEINTIHSLGLSLIKRHWFRLGISPDPQIMEEEDGGAFIRRMLEEIPMDPKITDRLGELNRMLNLFSRKGFGTYHPFAWREQLAKLIELELVNGVKDLSENSRSFTESLNWLQVLYQNNQSQSGFHEGLPLGNLGIGKDLLDRAALELALLRETDRENRIHHNTKGALVRKSRLLKKFKAKSYRDYMRLWEEFYEDEYTRKQAVENNPDYFPALNELLDILDSITRDSDFFNHCREYTHLIFSLADFCLKHYSEFKKSNNLIDFSDMERYFRDLLNVEEVREEIQSSIKLVMVDEFQDCSPLQVEIFRELAQLAEDNYWVGDPKQAIYGFRGTDSSLIRQTVEALSRQEGVYAGMDVSFGILKSGFRSVPELVKLSNTIFTKLLAPQNNALTVQRGLVNGDERSQELKAWKEAVFGENSHAEIPVEDLIELFASRESIDEPHLLRLDTVADSQTPEDGILLAIKHLLNPDNNIQVGMEKGVGKRGIRPADIAILCRDNAHVHAFVKTLKENGIPVSQQGADFYNEPEFRLMHNLFFLVQKPWDSLARTSVELLLGNISRENTGAYLLKQHKLGLERRELPVEEKDEKEGKRFEELFLTGVHPVVVDCYRHSAVLGVAEISRRLVSGMDLPFKVSGWSGSELRRRNLQHFISLCDRFQDSAAKAGKPASVHDFLLWLERNKEDLKSAAGGDADAVHVLTIHKAKGLEWPVVIPVGKPGTLTNLDKIDELYQSCFYPEENGNEKYIRFAFNPFGSTTKFPGNAKQHFSPEALDVLFKASREEHLRLMYVTTTRPRDLLVDLKFKPSRNTDKYLGFSSLFPDNQLEEIDLEFPAFTAPVPGEKMVALAQLGDSYFSPNEVPAGERRPFFILPSKIENGGAANARVETVKNFESRISFDEVKGEAWDGMEDRKDELLGNLLHAIFYLEDIKNLSTDGFSEMAGRLFSITGENLVKLKNLHQAFFSWCHQLAGNHCRFHRELPLEMMKDGQVWTGTADLVLEGSNGVFLIDYKSYQGGEQAITNPVSDKYSGRYYAQLSAYREMLSAIMEDPGLFRGMYIFYPMSGCIVQVIEK
jgi:ATP-dependent exoDNAse (exonuclease V) beta subunit